MANLSNNSTVPEIYTLQEPGRILLITLGVIITTTGIPGNIMTCVAILRCRSLRTRLNIFIVNLCIADVITVGYVYPFVIFDLILGRHPVSLKWCKLNLLIVYVLTPTSFITIMIITISRYVKILHESKFEKMFSTRNTIIICVVSWIPGLIMASISDLNKLKYIPVIRMCLGDNDESVQSMYFMIPAFALPYVSSSVCYFRVWLKLRELELSLRGQSNDDPSRAKLETNRKQVSISFMIFMLYICLTMPTFIVFGSYIHMPEFALCFILLLYFGNSSLNCIVYGAMNKTIRRYYQQLLPAVWFVRKVHPTLHA